MAITINGTSNSIAGLAVGGLPDGTVDAATLAAGAVTEYDDNKLQSNLAILGFKAASNGSLAKYNLVDQIIDEYEDATGIDASASTNEALDTDGYAGGTVGANHPTGGTVTTYGNYKVHTFSTGTTTFAVPVTGTIDILAIAGGGGGGGGQNGAGGGAGGMIATSGVTVAQGNYSIVVGAGASGGHAAAGDNSTAANGADTTTGGITATAVGGGGGVNDGRNRSGAGGNGGSGGGSGENGGSAGTGVAGQGNAGQLESANSRNRSGAGGGAGEAGGTDGIRLGGDGLQNDFQTGSNQWYAGGGSSGSDSADGPVDGGQGGGGVGQGTAAAGGNGVDGTGGGGGGAGETQSYNGGDGGDGVVVSRYDTTSNFNLTLGSDLTLVSTATTASSAPTKADLVLLVENKAGNATINTDLKGYISRDGSAFTSAVTFVDEGSWGTNKKIYAAHDVDLSGIASGTSMKYKLTTHNQTSGKITKIHATSLGWK